LTFEEQLLKDVIGEGFGSQEYLRAFKKRPHVSRSKIDSYSNCTYLKQGDFFSRMNYNQMDSRYFGASSLVYDVLLSIYDVNSRSMAVARFMELNYETAAKFAGFIKSIKRPNFEVRIIGMQDNQAIAPLYRLTDMIAKNKLALFEADLFGKQVRHIAMDISSGMDFNVLLDDRIYKPGELINNMTMEQFEKGSRG
jgi:hypothetical protein